MAKKREGSKDIYREVGARISFYRRKRNLTQETFAEAVGISKTYLSKIESSHSDKGFSLEILVIIAQELGM